MLLQEKLTFLLFKWWFIVCGCRCVKDIVLEVAIVFYDTLTCLLCYWNQLICFLSAREYCKCNYTNISSWLWWQCALSSQQVLCVVGTTAQSCSIRLVLGNVCWQLASLARADVASIPGDYSGLVTYFHRMLKVCSSTRPVVLLMDSLDQLTSAHRAHSLAWLPRPLPPNVHMIVSTLPYEHDLLDTLRVIVSTENNFLQVRFVQKIDRLNIFFRLLNTCIISYR